MKAFRESEYDERIASYFNGEMSQKEKAAFERLLETDETLRREVEEMRSALQDAQGWFSEEAPGIERVKQLEIPSVAKTKARQRPAFSFRIFIRRAAWQIAAAAALFIIGFYFGAGTQTQVKAPVSVDLEVFETPEEGVSTVPAIDLRQQEEPPEPAKPLYVVQKNGTYEIETVTSSGSRALWVVDASFQLAQTSQ